MFLHQNFLYIPETIQTKLIDYYQNPSLASHFGIDKTWELIARNYYYLTLHHIFENYLKDCDIYLALKIMRHKLYGDL